MIGEDLIGKFCIVRTYSAGVFAGILDKREGTEVQMKNAIRIYSWEGACSLSQLAEEGTKKPDKCEFAIPVNNMMVTECIEILECTEKAKESILNVKSWKIDEHGNVSTLS